MEFNMYLRYPNILKKAEANSLFNPDEYDVLWEICEVINKTENVEFMLEGFRKEEVKYNWSDRLSRFALTTDWDLAMVMEQMPDVMKSVSENNYNFDIEFYEQGSEFNLLFRETSDDMVKVRYESWNTQAPENRKVGEVCICAVSEAFVEKSRLKEMLIKLYKDFIFVAEQVCGYLLEVDDESLRSFLKIKEII